MKFKPNVTADGVCWQIGYALGVAESLHPKGTDMVVTSLTDGTHNPGSLHPVGKAADIRTKDLTVNQARTFYSLLRLHLKPLGFDVVWEGGVGATPETTGAHVHVEHDPKSGEQFMVRTQ